MGSYPLMDNTPTRYEALTACLNCAGSLSQLARDLGIPRTTMWRIIDSSKQLPAEYVLLAERLYGVSRHYLRPDIYPPDARFIGVDRRADRVSFNPGAVSKRAAQPAR